MRYLDLTMPTPAENLAIDEALLLEAEAADASEESLRLWESPALAVVVGRSSSIVGEVQVENCCRQQVPILRRISGGAAVVIGPGCLMYALVLSLQRRPALRNIEAAHRFVLDVLVRGLRPLVPGLRCQGTSDLAVGDSKVSGNSVRVKRHHLLYHGTLLVDFSLESIERLLVMPPRQPAYRAGRPHRDFVANLAVPPQAVRESLRTAWNAGEASSDWPKAQAEQLVAERYGCPHWNDAP